MCVGDSASKAASHKCPPKRRINPGLFHAARKRGPCESRAPYMHYGVVGPDNRLKTYMPIPLPGPRLPHDMAFTEHYAIVNDFPMFWDPQMMEQGLYIPRFHKDVPSPWTSGSGRV